MNFKRGFLKSGGADLSGSPDDPDIGPVMSTASSNPVIPHRGKIADELVSDAPAFPPERRARAQGKNIPLPTFDIVYASFPARKPTPSQAEELDGRCEAIVDSATERLIHATLSARPSIVLPRNETPAYRIVPAEGKGLGMFAARDLQTGDLILAERPLIMAPVRATLRRGAPRGAHNCRGDNQR
ncbi:hypothetical protein EV121DRAFT_295849 [Schizophyllum commune]